MCISRILGRSNKSIDKRQPLLCEIFFFTNSEKYHIHSVYTVIRIRCSFSWFLRSLHSIKMSIIIMFLSWPTFSFFVDSLSLYSLTQCCLVVYACVHFDRFNQINNNPMHSLKVLWPNHFFPHSRSIQSHNFFLSRSEIVCSFLYDRPSGYTQSVFDYECAIALINTNRLFYRIRMAIFIISE